MPPLEDCSRHWTAEFRIPASTASQNIYELPESATLRRKKSLPEQFLNKISAQDVRCMSPKSSCEFDLRDVIGSLPQALQLLRSFQELVVFVRVRGDKHAKETLAMVCKNDHE